MRDILTFVRRTPRYEQTRALARSYQHYLKGRLYLSRSDRRPATGHYHTILDVSERLARCDKGRYVYLLVKYLSLAGHSITIKPKALIEVIGRGEKFACMIPSTPGVRFSHDLGSEIDWLFTDRPEPRGDAVHVVRLVYGHRLTVAPRRYDLLFPYMLHPLYYERGWHDRVAALRDSPRRLRLTFSGNTKGYSQKAMRRFEKLARLSVIETVLTNLPSDRVFHVVTPADLARAKTEIHNCFVWVDKSQTDRVAKEEWLPFLASSDFFLACPGLIMPLAHNMVEAMSVGCIPVTESPEYFDPPLEHGVNCIAFSGAADLICKVQRLFEMPPDEVALLRDGVVRYYESHLTPQAFLRKLESLPKREIVLAMNFVD